jgi:hypothetical protein
VEFFWFGWIARAFEISALGELSGHSFFEEGTKDLAESMSIGPSNYAGRILCERLWGAIPSVG